MGEALEKLEKALGECNYAGISVDVMDAYGAIHDKHRALALIAKEMVLPASRAARGRLDRLLDEARRNPQRPGQPDEYRSVIRELQDAAMIFATHPTLELESEYIAVCEALAGAVREGPELRETWRVVESERGAARARPPVN
jgi:hypothetical protein